MKQRKKRREQIGILEGLAAEAIRCGADMIEVEYDEGYEEVYIRKGNIGLGTRFKGSEGDLLRKALYGLAKKKRQMGVDNVEYELRARVYDSFGGGCFSSPMEARLKWATLRAA
jgi:hypothetical protein